MLNYNIICILIFFLSYLAPPRRQDGRKMQSHIQSEWQPLSMNALVEYKKALKAQGEGEFDNGRIKMWPVVSFS